MTKQKFNLDAFLDQAAKARISCAYCRNEILKTTLDAFMQKRATGKTHVSLNCLYEKCLVPELGAPKSLKALYNHVRNCMQRDTKTGKPLNDET